jgi:hypothetical protein
MLYERLCSIEQIRSSSVFKYKTIENYCHKHSESRIFLREFPIFKKVKALKVVLNRNSQSYDILKMKTNVFVD